LIFLEFVQQKLGSYGYLDVMQGYHLAWFQAYPAPQKLHVICLADSGAIPKILNSLHSKLVCFGFKE
jgi:hypothetical protein